MNADQFYRESDLPSTKAKNRMWKAISGSGGPARWFVVVRDSRSFFSGMAAAFLLLLSGVGVSSLVDRFMESQQPREIRFDDAYRSAIKELENVLPIPVQVSSGQEDGHRMQSRLDQLKLIDEAIMELRSGIAPTDLSPMTRSRLRRLYSMKLQVLQDIIQQGDMEL